MDIKNFTIPSDKTIRLKDFDPAFTDGFKNKEEAKEKLDNDILEMSRLQDILYANSQYGILMVIQAMDAAGKDGIIKHVMSGINPQGCEVYSFKIPSTEELKHDYMWRCMQRVPEKGRIGIFNRSYYEEVLVVRVHPEILNNQNLPDFKNNGEFWDNRFEDINNIENYLYRNGIIVLKFFLHVSKEEQRNRFLDRINNEEKNWKFSAADAKERKYWDDYQLAYEIMLNKTNTEHAPWYIIPADKKWFTRAAVSEIIVRNLRKLNLEYPKISKEQREELLTIKKMLEDE
jgi:PPK2 family polyphosphate:nucleotide phosphotransferase